MIHVLDNGFEQRLDIMPAWDRRDPDPSKDYGTHCVDMRFILKGPKGAVQFVLYTGWYLNHNGAPMPADLGYHSIRKPNSWATRMTDGCNAIGRKVCYYNGSGLQAERVFKRMVTEGEVGVWAELEEYYADVFDD